jgi:RNA polymerase sigma factor (TIGR02999 family)
VPLQRARQGDQGAGEKLYKVVEAELRRLAHARLNRLRNRLRRRGVEPSLLTTNLIDDAYLWLAGTDQHLVDRSHFVAIAAHIIRSLCRDYTRRRLALKRGGRAHRLPLERADHAAGEPALDPSAFLDLDVAIERLAALDIRQAKVVELRFFGGRTDAELARVLSISESTVRREWRSARVWLRHQLGRPKHPR